MNVSELLLIAVGLSMDAFAVAVCKGLAVQRIRPKQYALVGLWFGGFQALMPLAGYFLGASFERYITNIDHWIAFVLLLLIGGNMIKEGLTKKEESVNASFGLKSMFLLAVATSIDALAVGVTFGFLPDIRIVPAVGLIGIITFALSAVGLKAGNVFGLKYKSKAEVTGGVILILIGTKILLEHLELLPF